LPHNQPRLSLFRSNSASGVRKRSKLTLLSQIRSPESGAKLPTANYSKFLRRCYLQQITQSSSVDATYSKLLKVHPSMLPTANYSKFIRRCYLQQITQSSSVALPTANYSKFLRGATYCKLLKVPPWRYLQQITQSSSVDATYCKLLKVPPSMLPTANYSKFIRGCYLLQITQSSSVDATYSNRLGYMR
jgi:hypothetical protein